MKTCTLCKTRVDEEEGQLTESGKFVCTDCGNEIQEDSAFCEECGEIKEDGKCSVCSTGEEDDEDGEDDEDDKKDDE